MATIFEDLDLPGGFNPRQVTVHVFLAGDAGAMLPAGYATVDGRTIIGQRIAVPNATGRWSITLPANDEISPDGTVWGVKLSGPGDAQLSSSPRYFTVPAGDAELELRTRLTDPPGSIDATGLALHQALIGVPGGHLPLDGNTPAYVLTVDDDGIAVWAPSSGGGPGGAVASVNGRTGIVTGLAEQSALVAEAALARNANNLTSGLVDDARIPSTIARDSEVTTAVAAEASTRASADTALSGRVTTLETTPPHHAATHTQGGTDELSLAQAQIVGLVAALASKATPTDITTAINNLVGGAPGLLDTLDEIANALGDDPNFAATITTALAGKQPLSADLTAIAVLSTTSTGRALLTIADASAGRTALGLGTAATAAASSFATAAQGAKADTAVQPGSLATVATTGAYSDLVGKPTLGTAAALNSGTGSGNLPTVAQADARYERLVLAVGVKSASYAVGANEFVPLDTAPSGTFVSTLPTGVADGTVAILKWINGTVAPSVATSGSDVFNLTGGATTAAFVAVNQVLTFRYRALDGIWYVETSFSKGGLDALYGLVGIPSDQTTDFTLTATMVNQSVGVNAATAKTATVPPNSSVAIAVGATLELRQVGAGQVTVAAGVGVTLRSAGSALKTRAQYSAISLLKVATDVWSVQGDLTT